MKEGKTRTIEISQIKENLFVRRELDTDHALYLAGLIEGGIKLKPMEVTEDLVMIDGRHRKVGYELNGITEVEVKILTFDNEVELIAYAYKANCGGAKPPTPSDTEHTIQLLLEKKVNVKGIAEKLGLPAGMIKKYVDSVRSRMDRAKLQQARAAVAEDGMKPAEAAEKFGANLDKLKELLSGQKSKKKRSEIAETCQLLSRHYKSNGLKSANALRKLLEAYDEGDVTDKQVMEVFQHIEDHQKRSAQSMNGWLKRFEAKVQSAKDERSKVA